MNKVEKTDQKPKHDAGGDAGSPKPHLPTGAPAQERPAIQPGEARPKPPVKGRTEPAGGQNPRNQAGERLTMLRPVAEPARMRKRHWGLIASFVLGVVLPTAMSVLYLFVFSADQYASTVGFTVRREEGVDATAGLFGGLAQFAGTGMTSESDILYEFIQSQEIVEEIDARMDLRTIYSQHWPRDPVFALDPTVSIEDLLYHWQRMVRISYDQSTRLIELRVLAFSADDARRIAEEILREGQRKINDLNAAARQDVMRYANEDLEVALERLKKSREAMTQFRIRSQIVDPESDIQGRMGVLSNLQQQLAEALIDYDLLLLQTDASSGPRVAQAQRRIDVIRDRIAAERNSFATASNEVGELNENYPELIAEYESLSVDREYAEESYRLTLAAVDVARAEAARQSLYLAPFIRPTLPETSEYPQRFVISGLIAVFLLLAWSILTLAYYSLRDRR